VKSKIVTIIRAGKANPARLMAVAEGWAMCRHKGAIPFVIHVKEINEGVDQNPLPTPPAAPVAGSHQ